MEIMAVITSQGDFKEKNDRIFLKKKMTESLRGRGQVTQVTLAHYQGH